MCPGCSDEKTRHARDEDCGTIGYSGTVLTEDTKVTRVAGRRDACPARPDPTEEEKVSEPSWREELPGRRRACPGQSSLAEAQGPRESNGEGEEQEREADDRSIADERARSS
ncbi:unnamed protein product [Prorocentrum cordatum]|uniref:Uncharacterized protein n=1 Tax=Prorocentrum cordatum TaxID=2364126 RepID=A0ABN9T1I6_9DINO|nr:unnamed protein product [Polarella glacialis]